LLGGSEIESSAQILPGAASSITSIPTNFTQMKVDYTSQKAQLINNQAAINSILTNLINSQNALIAAKQSQTNQ
jgi:hypothetical protein